MRVFHPISTPTCQSCGSIRCMQNTDVIFKDLSQAVRDYIAQMEARVAKLEQQVADYQQQCEQKDKRINELEKQNQRLQFQNAKLIHDKYGAASERVVTQDGLQLDARNIQEQKDDGTSGFSDDVEPTEAEIKAAIQTFQGRHQKKKHVTNPRKKIPAYLPRIIDEITLPKSERRCPCGGLMYEIGKTVSEKVSYTPARLEVIQYIRPKYGCRTCYEHTIRTPLPKMPIPKSYAHPTLLAHTIVSKYCDHLPLHRQGEIWKRQDVEILKKDTMIDWMNKCGELLAPIVECMKTKIINSGYARADETTLRVLYQDGNLKKSKGFIWLFMTGDKHDPTIVYEYHPTRSGEVANQFFENFKGTLLVDGYSGYNALRLNDNITVAGCNAHMRRKFYDIVKTSKKSGKALEAINLIQQLYKIEDQAKAMSNQERLLYRQQQAKPIWQSFKFWLNATKKTTPPKSPLGLAIQYALNHYQYLTRYLSDGRVDICNNWAENQIRPIALGRKNWRLQSSSRGAKASAVLYSLASTCKARGINPFDYFTHALSQAQYCKTRADWERLVPGNIEL